DDAPDLVLVELHSGPGRGEVVELLGIDVGDDPGVPLVVEVGDGRGGGVARVVPALERRDEHRPVEGGSLPPPEVHAPSGVRGRFRPGHGAGPAGRGGAWSRPGVGPAGPGVAGQRPAHTGRVSVTAVTRTSSRPPPTRVAGCVEGGTMA